MSAPQPSMWDKLKSGIAGIGETAKKGVESVTGPTALTSDAAATAVAGTPSSTYTMAGGKRRKTRKGGKKSRKTRRR
jgi:hypothetical protein